MLDFKCEICGAEFYYKRYLSVHQSRIHGIKKRKANTNNEFACTYCEKSFAKKKTLSKHLQRTHNIRQLPIKCQENNCAEKFNSVGKLRNHLKNFHQLNVFGNSECLNFETYLDFREWLAKEERNTATKYIRFWGKKLSGYKYETFMCNRSGTYKPKARNSTSPLKDRATIKLGFHCTSTIQVKHFDTHLSVTYFKKHYKHEVPLIHTPIPEEERQTATGSDDLISRLIRLRYERRDEFKIAGKRGNTHDAWMSVIRDMHLENKVSVLAVRKKWNSLLNKFKDIENKLAVGSCSEDVAWPHYNQMQTIMNELSSQENPSILATGNNNETVKIQFSDSMNNEGIENDEGIPEHKLTKRDRRDIIDERFIAAVEAGNEQLKAMNATLEKQGETFLQLMSRLVSAMETQVGDDVSM